MLLRIIIGLIITALGVAMVMKTDWFSGMVGAIPWAEAHLGGGGTRSFIKLIGIAGIFIGFIVMTNLWESFLGWILSPLLPHSR
jgi:hypothetical protein